MQTVRLSTWQRVGPVITLLVLAPLIAEFLFGSTHITTSYLFIVQMGGYGCASLIIRDLVRRQHKGWLAILLLGVAYALLEECVVLQSSLYPLFSQDIQHIYDRAFGVNWVYLLTMLVYESIWGIVLPILLCELIFPARRAEPWLNKQGFIITIIGYLVGSGVAWFSWTQHAVPTFYPKLNYQPSLPTIALAIVVAILIAVIALGPWPLPQHIQTSKRSVPWPWLVGLLAFMLALPWFILILFHYGVAPSIPVAIPLIGGIIWVALAFWLIWYWSGSTNWQDRHLLALSMGALLASMLAGFVTSGVALPIDRIGKLVLNIIAIVLLAYLGYKIRHKKLVPHGA
ncbi:hypothetical protein KDA_43010 [Dictyobacter alpinus]|uniref:Uncharacterized protein n=1 Tax=Dictyobacter alpinus TaxID=2014873 RepID=A0A402BC17_9CHLR|nr:hypothetical protein [Dictyobacter alpinus]GCE28817.1 hypothetical protein KDA_43010 [Dictyobacter alpinus]